MPQQSEIGRLASEPSISQVLWSVAGVHDAMVMTSLNGGMDSVSNKATSVGIC